MQLEHQTVKMKFLFGLCLICVLFAQMNCAVLERTFGTDWGTDDGTATYPTGPNSGRKFIYLYIACFPKYVSKLSITISAIHPIGGGGVGNTFEYVKYIGKVLATYSVENDFHRFYFCL